QSYVTAYNNRDAEAVAALWSPEGIYTIRTSGEQISGRDALEKTFSAMFASDAVPRLEVSSDSIEFISPNVALERGVAKVFHPDKTVQETNYRVVYVRREGKWLIDRVTEDEVVAEQSNYKNLKELEWIIGSWVDEDGEVKIKTDVQWTKHQNYISRTYAIKRADHVESSGLQIIGWDARKKQIRSWLFDSSGTQIDGTWTRQGDNWVVQSVATLPDGSSGSFTSIFRPLDDDRYAWRKINRVIDGQILPNIDEVVIRRD
ncbi:MAG: SgcJ/EcaC family oxidoreductase, partial [Planctomycetales bacterium]